MDDEDYGTTNGMLLVQVDVRIWAHSDEQAGDKNVGNEDNDDEQKDEKKAVDGQRMTAKNAVETLNGNEKTMTLPANWNVEKATAKTAKLAKKMRKL